MIIAFDGSRAFGKSRTGTENYAFQLLKHLAKIDQKNIYKVYLRPGSVVDGEWPDNFQFRVLNFPRLWTQVGLAKQTFLDRADVLFVPSHTLPLIRRPGLKTVLTIHDLGAEYLPAMHQLKQRLYLKLMTDIQLRSASHLIAVSEATKRDLQQKVGLSSSSIGVIYEGYNESLKSLEIDSVRNILKQYDIDKKDYLLFIGTIQPRKNLERLIESFYKYIHQSGDQNLCLVLAGGKGWLSESIYQLPKTLGIADRVKFLGYVPDEHLAGLYSGAKAFVFPSLFEGFGLPVLESFACNCPVLTSNSSSLPEVAGDAAVLVDPYSVESITEGISSVLNPKNREQLINKGKKQLKQFSWQKAAQETLKILENVANK